MIRIIITFILFASSSLAQLEQPLVPINEAQRKVTLSIHHFNDQKVKADFSTISGELGNSMQSQKKLSGVVAGVSDRYGKLIGKSILNGKNIGGKASTTGAIITVSNGKLSILAPNQASNNKTQIAAAPYLLKGSKISTKLDARRHSRRTFLLTDQKGNWAIGYAPNMTEAQLAYALNHYIKKSKKPYTTALQLSSGNQCGFWASMQGYHPYYLKELNKPQLILCLTNR